MHVKTAPHTSVISGFQMTGFMMKIFSLVVCATLVILPITSVAFADDDAPTIPTLPPIAEGDTIFNPVTGTNEIVEYLSDDREVVYTTSGNVILRAVYTGMDFEEVVEKYDDDGVLIETKTTTYKIGLAYDANGNIVPITDPNYMTKVVRVELINEALDADDPDYTIEKSVVHKDTTDRGGITPDQSTGGSLQDMLDDLPRQPGDTNEVSVTKVGARGKNGKDGGGIRVCIFRCFTIGVSPGAGGRGADGPNVNEVIDAAHGDIQTNSNKVSGITVFSVGGTGGKGGDAYGNMAGARGGAGGRGGDVTLTNHVNVTTRGEEAHGIYALSGSGKAGNGGSGYILGGGATGGAGGLGGEIIVTNYGRLVTYGDYSAGIMAQSFGGAAGSGGDGFGLIGDPGTGSEGGSGGNVTVDNYGDIITQGMNGYGIFAQSIGGTGGGSGNAGGIVSFGESGAAGGSAGNVIITAHETSQISTGGHGSHGIFAQSIGGGGGNSGYAHGVAGLGASGAGGGDGGDVEVENKGLIETLGDFARGIFGQSIGGGGGSGGDGGGLVSIGGSGGAASKSGNVIITNTGVIRTSGAKSDGIFAQSIGGGGGDGGSSGGAFLTIGGSGASGGDSGEVTVNHGGYIGTSGDDARGIFAQAVGGGGGAGGNATSGSAFAGVAIGGNGGKGGQGGKASVVFNQYQDEDGEWYNASIHTLGERATAVMVQSVGGGGGVGGYSVQATVGYIASVSVSIGGSGGDGGDGGKVDVDGILSITTEGDFADGLFAQSVGGGGGSGGMSIAASVAAGETGAVSSAISIGGYGGDGGDGGDVDIDAGGKIVTGGNFSKGLLAQSVGGGGGNGGFSIAASGAGGGVGAAAISVGLGGSGGKGGDGMLVNVDYDGTILTTGEHATGALIQSVGGGGGAGGMNISGAAAFAGKGSAAMSFGMGGSGGDGGAGGIVTASLHDSIVTSGAYSSAAIIQSVGGGGGSGGMNISGSLNGSGGSGVAAALGFGGSGGAGGDSNTVTAEIYNTILTMGDHSRAIIAQSVGGGGGAGGMNISGSVSIAKEGSGGIAMGVGGLGGDGGDAGDVKLTRVGDTQTTGLMSDVITVQSVGGGGGAGGTNISGAVSLSSQTAVSVGIGVGGFGGGGGDAAKAEADITGKVIATGHDYSEDLDEDGNVVKRHYNRGSSGIIVQSVGGSGGAGGMNISGSVAFAPPSDGNSYSAGIGIGGFGGTGGEASEAKLTLKGTADDRSVVSIIGDNESAVMVQSVGGGGGKGGVNISGALAMDGTATVGIGGYGGAGGKGGTVLANIDSDIYALGNNVRGILAQSVGGGGGKGGINISGSITGNLTNSGPSVAFGLGGSGGDGNTGGNVTLNQNGVIMVEGEDAVGLMAQSVGGSGGDGALNVAASASAGKSEGSFSAAIGIGGDGGEGGDAGIVDVTSKGDIILNGRLNSDGEWVAADFAKGGSAILVQSIGGGGGNGGMNIAGAASRSSMPLSIAIGASGGAAGLGGNVNFARGVTLDANDQVIDKEMSHVVTFGDHADGIMIQSVGGGGGRAGINVAIAASLSSDYAAAFSLGGAGGDGNDAGNVEARHAGHITTHGEGANALVAQSVGGGGGKTNHNASVGAMKDAAAATIAIGGQASTGGDGGNVLLEHWGNIVTKGKQAVAILAQSVGGGGGSATSNQTKAVKSKQQLNVSIGRSGGDGGVGGDVRVIADGSIMTDGDESTAVMAQSVGGGGGKSSVTTIGMTAKDSNAKTEHKATLRIGSDGGEGGDSGDIKVTTDGVIATKGERARGIFAQSIGGGGGIASDISINNTSGSTLDLGLSLGGAGGDGGRSGKVEILNSATIQTLGSDADAILAQSIGGGGGVGSTVSENTLARGDSVSDKNSMKLSISFGGDGGAGSSSDNVTVDNKGLLLTSGDRAFGIRAQSIGGGGGIGGSVKSVTLQQTSSQQNIEIGLGGSGGKAKLDDDGNQIGAATRDHAGIVTVTNSGGIFTQGLDAIGIAANSIGGGGGDAGIITRVTAGTTGGKESHRFSLNIGGSGGEAGSGGDVFVTNLTNGTSPYSGQIVTLGDNAHGILAQSLGGGGGNGSSIMMASAMLSGQDSASIGLNLGGKGGKGGISGLVTVINEGLIDTSGNNAHGIIAQSIGGGGGNGGFVLSGNALLGGGNSLTPMISIGGSGGDGGHANQVTVNNKGTIVTRGDKSHGIIAQSIGGGGGNAGLAVTASNDIGASVLSNSLALALGAVSSGDGGNGGLVTVNHSGDISVFGKNSQAIIAQSINGGGGNINLDFDHLTTIIGLSDTDQDTNTYVHQPQIVLSSGGTAVSDMNANKVVLNLTGTFGASGDFGAGSQSQAIGGGGGNTNFNIDLVEPEDGQESVPVDLTISLGGKDGRDNMGGELESTHNGIILADGVSTYGVFEQSIGGGGGRTVIDANFAENMLLGQVNVTLGGTTGLNEAGGNIARHQKDMVLTTGNYAAAAVWQSIGGGGGVVDLSLTDQGSASGTGSMVFGAKGGMVDILDSDGNITGTVQHGRNLHGGNINNTLDGIFATGGDYASAVIAQSIGAGGGFVTQAGEAFLDTVFGGTDDVQGDGGDITLTSNDMILAAGRASHGVFLQSIGGGGGAVFGERSASFATLNSDNTGHGGNIDFRQSGGISVSGDNAYAVMAQSLGGGGGWIDGGFAQQAGGIGQGGDITLDFADDVLASGENAVAIFAQSLGLDASGQSAQGDIRITANGNVRGGTGDGAAIIIDGGATNRLDVNGNISSASGQAIRAGAANETVYNSGIIVGNIDLGTGHNVIINGNGAEFTAYETMQLYHDDGQSSGAFINDGDFSIGLNAPDMPDNHDASMASQVANHGGGMAPMMMRSFRTFGSYGPSPAYVASVATTTNITGNFTQNAGGNTNFDVSFGPYASDRLIVSGDADMAGTGTIRLLWLEDLTPVTLIETGGTFIDNGFTMVNTMGLKYSLRNGSRGMTLHAQSDFAKPFMNRNQNALAKHMDSALSLGNAQGIGRVMAYLANMNSGDEALYHSVFNEMNPEAYVAPMVMHLSTANNFNQNMYHCDPIWQRNKDDCARFAMGQSYMSRDASGDYHSLKGNTTDFVGNFEKLLNDQWSVLGALGFTNISNMHVDDNRARIKGNGMNAGIGLRWEESGGYDVSLSLVGGWNWLDASRSVNVFDIEKGEASYQTQYARTGLRMGQKWMVGDAFFARAGIDFSTTALRQGSFNEKGLDSMNIKGESHTTWIGSVSPELTIGTVFENTPELSSTGSLTFGLVHNSKDQIRMPYRFTDTNVGANEAMIGTGIDRNAFKVDGNLDLWSNKQFGAQLNLRHIAGENTNETSANIRLKARF